MKKIYPLYGKEKVTSEKLKRRLKLSLKEKKVFKDFLEMCKLTCNEGSAKDTETVLLQVRDVIEKSLTSLRDNDVREFGAIVNNSTRGEWAKNDSRIVLKRFIKFYYKDWSARFPNLDKELRYKDLGVNHDKLNSGTLLTEEELERMLRAATGLRDKLILILSYELGARPHELRLMKWEQVKLNREPATITLITHKGSKDLARTLPIKESKIHFERWKQEFPFPNLNDKDFVFPNPRHRDKPLTDNGFSYIIPKIAQDAGIQRRVYGYLLRHTRLTDIRKKGMQEKMAMMFGGHSDPEVSDIYTHLNADDLESEVLTKLYHITEPTPEQKSKMQKEIDELKVVVKKIKNERDVEQLTGEVYQAVFERLKLQHPELIKEWEKEIVVW